MTLADEYWNNDESFRKIVRDGWNFGVRWQCPKIIAPPQCNRTEEEQERIIRANLLYFSISASDVLDASDALIDIAVIYHECLSIGFSPSNLFALVAQRSIPGVRKILIDFINRPDEDKSMEVFCLQKSTEENWCVSIECELW